MPCLGDTTVNTPCPPPPPITQMFGSLEGGGGGVMVICSAVLGRRHGEHNLFPPHIPRRFCFVGGDRQRAVPCLGDAATVEQCLPHSQGRVTRMALPLFFCRVVHRFQLIGIFIFALYINHYSFSPHEYRCLKHCVFTWLSQGSWLSQGCRRATSASGMH